jgi:2,3-bisphosphoglycerate-independent phosphoglycerate mutase
MTVMVLTDELVRQLDASQFDTAIVNLANGDMVGHTGDIQAGIKACEIVDEQVGRIAEAVIKANGILIITADHGNVEEMIDLQTGAINTKHSTAPVPLIIVGQEFQTGQELPTGVLGDVAPTMLKLMNIKQPAAMTGKALL